MTRTRRRSELGQLLVPMAGLLMVLGILSAGYLRWCRALYWRTRMEMAADAAALSAARAQAQMLNRISFANGRLNAYVTKTRVPFAEHQIGGVSAEKYPRLMKEAEDLTSKVRGFKTYSASVGQIVARANGAEGLSVYSQTGPLLIPKSVHVVIYTKTMPPAFWYRTLPNAYYARGWSPGFQKAQPPHRTLWLVRKSGFQALSAARLWLDVPPESFLHNGGFPRVREGFTGDVAIQSFWPQFSARLAPRPRVTPQEFLNYVNRQQGISGEI